MASSQHSPSPVRVTLSKESAQALVDSLYMRNIEIPRLTIPTDRQLTPVEFITHYIVPADPVAIRRALQSAGLPFPPAEAKVDLKLIADYATPAALPSSEFLRTLNALLPQFSTSSGDKDAFMEFCEQLTISNAKARAHVDKLGVLLKSTDKMVSATHHLDFLISETMIQAGDLRAAIEHLISMFSTAHTPGSIPAEILAAASQSIVGYSCILLDQQLEAHEYEEAIRDLSLVETHFKHLSKPERAIFAEKMKIARAAFEKANISNPAFICWVYMGIAERVERFANAAIDHYDAALRYALELETSSSRIVLEEIDRRMGELGVTLNKEVGIPGDESPLSKSTYTSSKAKKPAAAPGAPRRLLEELFPGQTTTVRNKAVVSFPSLTRFTA